MASWFLASCISGCCRRDTTFEAADDLALVFQRLRVLDAEFEGEVGEHLVVARG
jgi:hypothetical protein